jgi:hypothetical protein
MFRDEGLLTKVAPLPVLSATLRSRVLAAACAARARRRRARRVVAGAFALFGVLALFCWSEALPLVTKNLAAIESGVAGSAASLSWPAGRPPRKSAPYCRRDMLISAMSDDWRMVEAEFKSREEFTRRVQM